jgi:tricorn protease
LYKTFDMQRYSLAALLLMLGLNLPAQGTRLLRQPHISEDQIVFTYGADLWTASLEGGDARRLTSTAAVERNPYFSPDGSLIAFSSNRSGSDAVYIVSSEGGAPQRLTWHPADCTVQGWTPDGERILFASSRGTAPRAYDRLWTVSKEGGPATLLPAPWGARGAFSPDGERLIVDRVSRWDSEWRAYRGGQNTPLTLLELGSLEETRLPNERTTDTQPVWLEGKIYFLSDRDWVTNIWSYDLQSQELEQLTKFEGADIKWLSGQNGQLAFERAGYLHTMDPQSGEAERLRITVLGDFPWTRPRFEDVSSDIAQASLSATGKRALIQARGEIFTLPADKGDVRNLSKSSDAADRKPVWSPDGGKVAWFSDKGGAGYGLVIADQDGLSEPRRIDIKPSKMAWNPSWSPDGKYIAFVDDDVRIQVVELATGQLTTADVGGANIERSSLQPRWSPDSKWLAYAKTGDNRYRRLYAWSLEQATARPLSGPLADAHSPAWDRNGQYLYFLASTELGLAAGWANTSNLQAEPDYGAYLIVLQDGEDSPFQPESDEEPVSEEEEKVTEKEEAAEPETSEDAEEPSDSSQAVRIDWEQLDRRTLAMPLPQASYAGTFSGPAGSVFLAVRQEGQPGFSLKKFELKKAKATDFASGLRRAAVSADGKKILLQQGKKWRITDTGKPSGQKGGESLSVNLRMKLDRRAEWKQIFEEAWRYERDYFYDPDLHGRNWQAVYERYAPLIPYVRHRADLNYILDQMNGELSVGHSFVFGGDMPAVDTSRVGLLGADLVAENGYWRIERIYTSESWNPGLKAPLDRPGLDAQEGDYLMAVNGEELTAEDNPYELLDGTAGRQTLIFLNEAPQVEGARELVVEPIRSERGLRQRSWVEDNRRRVAELSDGKLAYVWIPNTATPGVVSFNRYFFAQQDKAGAVIDERFNGGGLLDDYMVDLMTRKLRAAITNEAPGGKPFRLPAGILGPKVLLINELAGSGGDFFPWVFRQQEAGPLIGTRTWGGLVKSSVHYRLVDGGALTAPDNAVFDPIRNEWIGENEGIAPDIPVQLTAKAAAEGRDPQLERAVEEALRLLEAEEQPAVAPPPFPKPAVPED